MAHPTPAEAAIELSSPSEPHTATDDLYEQIRRKINLEKFSAADAVNLITTAMVAAEKVGGMTGPEKKGTVLHLLERLIAEIPVSNENKAAIQLAVATLAPGIIDTIVAASRGQVVINLRKKCAGCCIVS